MASILQRWRRLPTVRIIQVQRRWRVRITRLPKNRVPSPIRMISFLRIKLALAIVLMSLTPAAVNAASRAPIVIAFQEESIPAADLAQPSPAASSSAPSSASSPPTSLAPAADSNADPGSWERVPTAPSAPAAQASPAGFQAVSAPAAAVPAVPPQPAEIPPAMDVGALIPTPQI